MSNQIETHYVNSFKSGIETAFQQTESLFRSFVETGNQTSEYDFEDRVGIADDVNEVATRFGVNPIMDVPHDRRRTHIKDFEWGKPIDPKDLVRVATDPTSAYNMAGMAAHKRKMDDRIIAGLTATAYTGKEGDTAIAFVGTNSGVVTVGAVSNPAGNIVAASNRYTVTAGNYEGIDVAKNYTGTTPADGGLTLAKLKAVKSTMMGTLAITDQRQFPVINAFLGRRQWEDLLGIAEITNGDYNVTKGRLERLEVTEWGGFRFMLSERLPLIDTNARGCLFFMPKAGKLKISTDITADMWKLPERKNIPYIYIKACYDFTRFWGECTARVRCVE
jgi:hypothetical protein